MTDPAQLVAHRPPMLLLAEVLSVDAEGVRALARVDPGAWYADPDGSMPGWFGIELMAQAVAAYSGARKQADGIPPRLGYLLGTQCYACEVPAFPAGAELLIEARLEYLDEIGLSAFQCTLSHAGRPAATALLKTFEAP
ncbi:ApeP family dehydratase [Mesoterricola sediminis]|uniref:3-hydroxylacyl-ACP dehydratase n=1 Tax=Mesoterricola sediminis TaxID=2927980 RepID=A0AA48HCB9_9BACT|nr:3-hydroxy-fatty acyl-ACP dehydratase [Mesoterricola sediminis]BDU75678.1 3-hydroxylacyl-ACP dehydratase [Mesoterricola sediminis]